jgi:hypothetical protein
MAFDRSGRQRSEYGDVPLGGQAGEGVDASRPSEVYLALENLGLEIGLERVPTGAQQLRRASVHAPTNVTMWNRSKFSACCAATMRPTSRSLSVRGGPLAVVASAGALSASGAGVMQPSLNPCPRAIARQQRDWDRTGSTGRRRSNTKHGPLCPA